MELQNVQEYFDIMWILICSMLVILMQAGFCCVESGFVRAKNSIHVAIKNLADFGIASVLFWITGFGFMFGASAGGFIGTSNFVFGHEASSYMYAFFLFQLAFCATATTIVSGAVAERIRFSGYLVISIILSGIIYPVAGHWVWGGTLPGTGMGWLAEKGFIDFAGSTVVHAVGGWIALAALIVIGPRLGRFGKDGKVIEGHNLTTATIGVFLLWVGWFGFNGGSRLALAPEVPVILVNTAVSGAAGAIAAVVLTWFWQQRPDVKLIINGTLAGLVSVSASAHILTPLAAIAVGAIGGFICVFGARFLERVKIDDAVGAVPVHLFGGIWGTLAVSLFAHPETYLLTTLEQLKVQFIGVAAVGLYSFGIGYVLLSLIDRYMSLRTSVENEKVGLNISEHGASTAMHQLLQEMEYQRFGGNFSSPVTVEPQTEAGQVAMQYNMILDKFNEETRRREAAVRAMRRARDAAEAANKTKSRFLANVSHELRTPLGGIISYSEAIRNKLFGPLGNDKYQEYVDTIHESGEHLLSLINDLLDLSKIEASKYVLQESQIDLNEIIHDMIKIIRPQADDKNLNIVTRLNPEIPDLFADRRAIKQILLNVLSNAVKFTSSKGLITVETWRGEAGGTSVRITDTGQGIPENEIQRVLEPFIQTEGNISEDTKGTGLGLPLTKSLVELHSGNFVLESELGVGTTITVHFPYSRNVQDDEADQPIEKSPKTEPKKKSARNSNKGGGATSDRETEEV